MGSTQSTALTTSCGYAATDCQSILGSTSSADSALPTGTCPSVSTTAITTYSSTVYTAPTTTTIVVAVYPNVETIYSSSVSTAFTSPYITTVLATSYLNTSIVVVPAQTTITVPTPSGFVPVLCEASWVQPTTSSPGIFTSSITEEQYSESTDLSTSSTTHTLITSVSTSTIPTTVTVTTTVMATTASTSTRNEATSTVYEACAANNVVKYVPDGQTIFGVDLYGFIEQEIVTAVDEYDCCALCQANSTCIGSIYATKHFFSNDGFGTKHCDLLFRQDGLCDPTFSGGHVTSKTLANSSNAADRQFFISNSGCGQILYRSELYQS